MKNTIKHLTLATLVAFISISFTTIEDVRKEIKTTQSNVVWKGYKVTGSHQGNIALKSGSLIFSNEKLTGGEFIIDMATITNTDLEGEYKGKLEGHLKSDDFFGVEKNPTATLIFKKVKSSGKNSYKVTGELTIKGHTDTVVFDLSVYGNKANAALKIDRSKYDVRFGSTSFFDNLKDKAIYDEFDLLADLEF
jgi:polyisoprenoid-binding protein YceI